MTELQKLKEKVSNYSHKKRIVRIIEIYAKGCLASPHELLEFQMIQSIRRKNGEIEQVKQMNKFSE